MENLNLLFIGKASHTQERLLTSFNTEERI